MMDASDVAVEDADAYVEVAISAAVLEAVSILMGVVGGRVG